MKLYLEQNDQGIGVVRAYDAPINIGRARTFIDEDTVADLLGYAAADMDAAGCKQPSCAYCNPARLAWWRACNSLSIRTRRGLQTLMRDAGVDLPEAPYEVVEDNVVPAAQHG